MAAIALLAALASVRSPLNAGPLPVSKKKPHDPWCASDSPFSFTLGLAPGVEPRLALGGVQPVRKMASRARLLVSSSLGTVVPEQLDTRYCDPANRTRNLLACATVQEPRSESNAFDESASPEEITSSLCALAADRQSNVGDQRAG